MLRAPSFKPGWHVEIVPAEGVFLLAERDHVVLRGTLYETLAPLLDGRQTADQIVDALAGTATPAEVYYALACLEQSGHIVESGGAPPADRAAFWDDLGLDASDAERRLRETVVCIRQFGTMSAARFGSTLAALGVQVSESGGLNGADFTVALTDDYLQPGLAALNAEALAAGRPWLLVKPVGTLVWIGPLFQPGQTGCWECLAHRLRGNREVEAYVGQRQQRGAPFTLSRAALPATTEAALNLAAAETAKAIARGQPDPTDATIVTLDLRTLETRRHVLVRRPQCARCGDGPARPDRAPEPLVLQSRPKRFTADGGHRLRSPEQTVARFGRHVSPITGAVSVLTRTSVGDGPLHVYEAGHNPARATKSLGSLRRALRTSCSGKGATDAQARASGLCEALERYAGSFQGDEPRTRSSYRALGARAIYPNACMLFSGAQYRRRDEWNAGGSRFQRVPEPFDETAEIEWTPVWSLTRQEPRYLPTGYLYYGYRMAPGRQYCWTDSNGNAAGNTLEEAILQGFMELVERDSVALWWYNRVRRPAVDLDSFGEPYFKTLREHYRQRGRELWVLDLTADLAIPAFAAISPCADQTGGNIFLGFGAHLDPRVGILRALGEVNQFFAASAYLDGDAGDDADDRDTRAWWQTATLANQPHLLPTDAAPRSRADYPSTWSDDLREDVLRCQALVERQGLELLVLDQTRPDIGLTVVKVIVPGLRHFWARLAPGRLYDVPVTLGWLDRPLSEEQLNPIPCFW